MGVTSCLSFIDIDSIVGLKALRAAKLAKEYAQGIGINFKIATQTLKGVVSPYERIYLDMALDTGVVDIIGSLPGAMLGGLLIGLIETMWSGYVSIEYKDVAAFSVLIIVLIFFPTGFLGKPDIEKV